MSERLASAPIESPAAESAAAKATRRPGGALWLMFLSHLVDDLYQGAVPALLLFLARLHRSAEAGRQRGAARSGPARRDDWRAFRWLTVLAICRSMVSFGVSSLLSLHVIRHLGGDTVAGGTALTALLASGTFATVAGGWLADRRGRLLPVRLAYSLVVPAPIGVLLAPSIPLAVVCAAALGVGIYLPFSMQTTLRQEYLPNRLGTASGVTLGLAVSAGGMVVPLLGMLADQRGLPTALAALLAFPPIALLCTMQMYDPARARGRDTAGS
ncbi:MAG: MFS transporter [Chloroflexi bacterium]|nr:MFS transporter [Chloroflexota bacterium]